MTPLLRFSLILAFAALPLASQTAPPPAHREGKAARALNLTEAQRTAIHAIREKHRPDLALHRDAARQARIALRTALQNPSTPEAQLRVLNDKASAARFEMMLARRAVRQEVRAILTPEQLATAAERRGIAQARRHERMRHLRMAAGMAG